MVYDHDHDDRITRVDIIQDENIFMLNTKFVKCSGIQSKTVRENIPGAFQSLQLSENNTSSFRLTSNDDVIDAIEDFINEDRTSRKVIKFPENIPEVKHIPKAFTVPLVNMFFEIQFINCVKLK